MGESTKAPRALVLFGFLGDHRNHPTAGGTRIQNGDVLLRRQSGWYDEREPTIMTTRKVGASSVPPRILFLLDGRFVKFLQKAALLKLLQETEIGDISRLQRSGLWIVFAVQDGLDRFFHRHGQRRQPLSGFVVERNDDFEG